MNVKVKRLSKSAIIPNRGKVGDAGFDLCTDETVMLDLGETIAIKTGIAIQLPKNCEAQVRPRSGISLKGIGGIAVEVVLGTVDSNYRGEIGIITRNIGTSKVVIAKGTKLAQMVIKEIPVVELTVTTGELTETDRGDKGFGSSGV